jgi:hypothetical protein
MTVSNALQEIPTRAQAEALLEQAAARNPGPWVAHSQHVALAAEAIACRHARLDSESAYIVGLLHDIGRQAGHTNMRHVLDGYRALHTLGYDDAARIALTHSFVIQDVHAHAGIWDCSESELVFVTETLAALTYTEYDRLIQLCDALAMAEGICLLEKRLMDVALRHGINAYTLPRWQGIFALQQHFEEVVGCSLYRLLPGVVETTFGAALCDEEATGTNIPS